MIDLFFNSLIFVLVYKVIVFVLSLILKRNDIADVSWGISFLLVAVLCLYKGIISPELILVSVLVFVWGFRLSTRILLRNLKKKEDERYAKLRKQVGASFLLVSLIKVYLLQGFLAVVVASPIIFIATNPNTLRIMDFIGVLLWLFGFYFEAVGDWQLDRFKNDARNKGKIMKYGLWKYSRHPNYFGEIVMWWGVFLVAASSSLFSIFGPMVITYLIMFVSGVPMLENKYRGNKEYEDYKKKTGVLVPLIFKG